MVLRLKQFYTGMQQISVMTLLTSLLKISARVMIYVEECLYQSTSTLSTQALWKTAVISAWEKLSALNILKPLN